MTLENKLNRLCQTIIEKAMHDAEFKTSLENIFGINANNNSAPRKKCQAILNPINVLSDVGEDKLREALVALSLKQLHDIVAQYAMDASGNMRKWRKPEKLIDKIVQLSINRQTHGSGFIS